MTDAAAPPTPIPVFVDCDTGIDDALALAYLLAEPRVRIVGIGTVSGNIDATRAAANTLALLERAGCLDIPVAIGANDPLTGRFAGGPAWVHGADGVGNTGIEPRLLAPVEVDAVELLARCVEAHEGALRVLALGPLTNLATFAQRHPALVARIAELVVMGGAFERPGNITPFAEANIFNDAVAAGIVFAAGWPATVLPLDITMRHALTEADARSLGALPGALPPVLEAMLGVYFDAYATIFDERACALHDPLAAMVLAGAARVVDARAADVIEVGVSGDDRGVTRVGGVVPGAGDATGAGDAPGAGRHRIVREIDGEAAALLLAALRAHAWPEGDGEPGASLS